MIAQGHFADAYDRIEKNDIVTHTAGQRDRREVITAGVTPGAEAFLAQRAGLRKQRAGIACRVVCSEHADDRRNTGGRKPAEGQRRHAAGKAGFTAATGDVRVTVDEPGQKPTAAEVDDSRASGNQVFAVARHGKDAPAADQQVLHAAILRRENAGVGEELQHELGPWSKKWPLYYTSVLSRK
jgi:hypothetical protein